MLNYLSQCLQICLLKQGPQDLPYSPTLAVAATLGYLGLIFALDQSIEQSRENIIFIEAILLLTSMSFVGLMLFAVSKSNRFIQAVSAILGTECLMTLAMLIIVLMLMPIFPSLLIVMIAVFLYVWRLTALCHIFKEMMSTDYVAATLLTVTFETLRIIMIILMAALVE